MMDDYKLVLSLVTLAGSIVVSFVTVKVSLRFLQQELDNNVRDTSKLFSYKDLHSNRLTKLETEMADVRKNAVSKDELKLIEQSITHIENHLSKMDSKMDKFMEIIIDIKKG